MQLPFTSLSLPFVSALPHPRQSTSSASSISHLHKQSTSSALSLQLSTPSTSKLQTPHIKCDVIGSSSRNTDSHHLLSETDIPYSGSCILIFESCTFIILTCYILLDDSDEDDFFPTEQQVKCSL